MSVKKHQVDRLTVGTRVRARRILARFIGASVGIDEALVALILGHAQARTEAEIGVGLVDCAASTHLGAGIAWCVYRVCFGAIDAIALELGGHQGRQQ